MNHFTARPLRSIQPDLGIFPGRVQQSIIASCPINPIASNALEHWRWERIGQRIPVHRAKPGSQLTPPMVITFEPHLHAGEFIHAGPTRGPLIQTPVTSGPGIGQLQAKRPSTHSPNQYRRAHTHGEVIRMPQRTA